MKVDALATNERYARHIKPIWHDLSDKVKGQWRTTPAKSSADITIVAGYNDLKYLKGAPAILASHGAGQTYSGDPNDTRAATHPSYPGGKKHKGVQLFLCPSQSVADKWLATYPTARAEVIGYPSLDSWHNDEWVNGRDFRDPKHPLVAVAFHWGPELCPETSTAIEYHAEALKELATRFDVIGTYHPNAKNGPHARILKDAGIDYVSYERVMDTASILCVDNSSIGWEFASLVRPVIWLNSPKYRKDIHHDLRFWDHGMSHCEKPENLSSIVNIVMQDRQEFGQKCFSACVPKVIAYADGRGSERAAAAILALL